MSRCLQARCGATWVCAAVAAVGVSMIAADVAPAQVPGRTIFRFPWDWHITVLPNQNPTGTPEFGEPIEIWLWGTADIALSDPVLRDGNAPETFDLGPGGTGPFTPSAEPPPEGGIYDIQTEILSMDLHSMMPVEFPGGTTDVILRNDPNRPSTGAIQNLRNLGDGTAAADSFFDIFVEIELPDLGMSLRSDGPMRAGMSFTNEPTSTTPFPPAPPVGALDIPWVPTWLWREIFVNENAPQWVDTAGLPWDRWVIIHGHVTVPEPGSVGLLSAAVGGFALVRRTRKRD